MAERGALWLLSLLWLTFLHTAAEHVDKGKRFYAPLVLLLPRFVLSAPRSKEANEEKCALWNEFWGLKAFSFCRTFKPGCVFISGALLTHPAAPARLHKSTRFPTLPFCLQRLAFTPPAPLIAVCRPLRTFTGLKVK